MESGWWSGRRRPKDRHTGEPHLPGILRPRERIPFARSGRHLRGARSNCADEILATLCAYTDPAQRCVLALSASMIAVSRRYVCIMTRKPATIWGYPTYATPV